MNTSNIHAALGRWSAAWSMLEGNTIATAVLDLHSPEEKPEGNGSWCAECCDAYGSPAEWPCRTYETVEQAISNAREG